MRCPDRVAVPWTLQRSCIPDRIQSPTLILIREKNKDLILEKDLTSASRFDNRPVLCNDQWEGGINVPKWTVCFSCRCIPRRSLVPSDGLTLRWHIFKTSSVVVTRLFSKMRVHTLSNLPPLPLHPANFKVHQNVPIEGSSAKHGGHCRATHHPRM